MAHQNGKSETVQSVFVDTAAWIALLNRRDSLHTRAKRLMTDMKLRKVPLVTTEFILVEVADALCAPPLRHLTVVFINQLRSQSALEVIPASSELFADGWALYSQRPDKEWGLTDCTSFAVMAREEITQAFTSDRHFEQSGFVKLL